MASIVSEPNKDGSITYKVWVRITGTTPVFKSFPTRFEAEAFANKEEARLRDLLRARRKGSHEEFFKERLSQTMRLFRETLDQHEPCRSAINCAIRIMGVNDPKIGELRPSFCEEFVEKALRTTTRSGGKYQPSSVATLLTAMSRAYRWRARKLDADPKGHPFSNIYLPKGWNAERDRRLTKQEEISIRLVLKKTKLSRQWLCIFNLAIETAARMQELTQATWSEFDLDTGVWLIPKAHTKSKKTRPVPLSERAVLALRLMAKIKKPVKTQRVFSCFSGTQMVSHAFTKYVKKADVEDFHFHDLRHEAITRMVLYRRNLSPYEIMRIVGHSSIEMLNRYTNLRGEEMVARFRGG